MTEFARRQQWGGGNNSYVAPENWTAAVTEFARRQERGVGRFRGWGQRGGEGGGQGRGRQGQAGAGGVGGGGGP